jgi:hypothetical protein
MCRDSSGGIATRPRVGRSNYRGSGEREFSLYHNVHTGSGINKTPYRIGTGSCSPGVERQGSECDHSHPSNDEVKNGRAIPSLLHKTLWRGA